MTIEINRRKSTKIFRINPYNIRCIDVRENKHGARWETHSRYDSYLEANEALMAIEREAKKVQP